MPELIEVERYRALAAEVVGRVVAGVEAPDAWYLKGGLDVVSLSDAVAGATVAAVRRIGKLLLVDLDEPGVGGASRPTLGLRFGMTGRLLLDGRAALEHLEYGSAREEPAWDRLRLHLGGGSELVMRDPRRLGGVSLDPDESRLGVDALALTAERLEAALGSSRAPLKARLMDQRQVAGLGNLLTDEALWRAGLSPQRPASGLTVAERGALAEAVGCTVRILTARGGSHTGDLQEQRRPGGLCPRDGAALTRSEVGGRTTWWCPAHQA
ncbi:MAG: formamidopyrimidine-DNA glycosylase [Acidimicrobiia bacterium]|nr:formamidopyrimidine-DNA glycosylase [Acidimicrobiia bacterium]